jgi:hypothetical protein
VYYDKLDQENKIHPAFAAVLKPIKIYCVYKASQGQLVRSDIMDRPCYVAAVLLQIVFTISG